MAIVVLVLWLFTAGAGSYLLVTSSLGRARTPDPQPAAPAPSPAAATAAQPAAASAATVSPPGQPAAASAATVSPPGQPAAAARPHASPRRDASRREMRRAARDRWDPPSLTAAKKAPMLPGARSVMEFAHPACGLIGLAFWLGFTLIHARSLGWIAFGLIAFTACVGLAWFTANARAARRGDGDRPAPYFSGRLMVLHGCAAAVTITLAALTALVLRG
ncbi:MAG TPA: hypothetical protein VEF71_08220 [Streptosporangiaceae bacterium]|nr:hypothetical protein [Streptosporangiaceae bacterium]